MSHYFRIHKDDENSQFYLLSERARSVDLSAFRNQTIFGISTQLHHCDRFTETRISEAQLIDQTETIK